MRWLALLALLFAVEAQAALLPFKVTVASAFGACTDGSDCLCDTISGSTFCEDFENPQWIEIGGSNEWHDAPSGLPGFRGGESLWQDLYGSSGSDCDWRDGEPVSPNVGSPCSVGSGSTCAAAAEWRLDDYYDGNDHTCMDFFQDGEEDDEVTGLTLTGGNNGAVFDGNISFAHRIAPGEQAGHGSDWGSCGSTCGLTFARAFSTNLLTAAAPASADFITQPWKGNQFDFQYQWPEGNTGISGHNNAPFAGGFGLVNVSTSTCNDSVIAAATVSIGHLECDGAQVLRFSAAANGEGPTAANEFDRSDDWPLGAWGCIRSYISGFGSSSTNMWIEFQGPNDSSPRRIFEVTGLDTGTLFGDTTLGGWGIDGYYNGNQGLGETPSTETFYRYFDNVVINSTGEPVTCAAIGF